jgi:transposase-like protein
MDCPKCKSGNWVKDGIIGGRQRYKCKECYYRYTVVRKSDVKTPQTRRLALELYLEGLGFRSIGRILKISYGTVYVWVQAWVKGFTLLRRENPVEIVEPEKLLSYIEANKATVRNGLLLIDLDKDVTLLSSDAASATPKR